MSQSQSVGSGYLSFGRASEIRDNFCDVSIFTLFISGHFSGSESDQIFSCCYSSFTICVTRATKFFGSSVVSQ